MAAPRTVGAEGRPPGPAVTRADDPPLARGRPCYSARMKTVTALAAILGALALSAGCGQRGPLVLPDAQQARPPATKAPAPQNPAR